MTRETITAILQVRSGTVCSSAFVLEDALSEVVKKKVYPHEDEGFCGRNHSWSPRLLRGYQER